MDNKIIGIIIANHREDSMKSSLAKSMHEICGHPMIEYVVECLLELCHEPPFVVVGEDYGSIRDRLGSRVNYIPEQKGFGFLKDKEGYDIGDYALVVSADQPLIRSSTLKELADNCHKGDYHALYISPSIYCFNISSLPKGATLANGLERIKGQGKKVGRFDVPDPKEIMVIDNRIGLGDANRIMRRRINEGHLRRGVTMIDPDTTYIGPHVSIGRDTIIYPGNILEGRTSIGEGCRIYQNSRIVDSTIGQDTTIETSVICESIVGDRVKIGPFAYLRPKSHIFNEVKIGDFVEVKNAKIHEKSKVSHLSYIGDGEVGENVNIGCGVIFVNYDGTHKHRTVVEDETFIGCNTNLVAPVRVKKGAYVAAGSTITEEVPPGALAIARTRQTNKEGWVHKNKHETREKKEAEEDR